MAAPSATVARQLNRLARIRPSQLGSLVPLKHEPLDPRRCKQGSREWFQLRQGRLTASRFSHVLGFGGPAHRRAALAELFSGSEASLSANQGWASANGTTGDGFCGSRWGHRYERSALATYLHAYVQPRCSAARVLETGFWPIGGDATSVLPPSDGNLALGASPDALLDGVDALFPGGVVVEVKCPYGAGVPRAQGRVHARQMPQLQGALLATGRAHCHLVTWSPAGASVFGVAADAAYQRAMVEALVLAVEAAREGRPLVPMEADFLAHVRHWSLTLAVSARLLASIEPRHCLILLEDEEVAEQHRRADVDGREQGAAAQPAT